MEATFSNILQEITCKNDWYRKCFDPQIIAQWEKEITEQSTNDQTINIFATVIRLLQATTQGSQIKEDCPWNDNGSQLCTTCQEEFKSRALKHPKANGFSNIKEAEKFFSDECWPFEEDLSCDHPSCTCIPPDCDLYDYISYYSQNLVSEDLRIRLKQSIAHMLTQETPDWHPGSNDQVLDIIHPSLYCYVKGVSDAQVSPDEETRYQWLPAEFSVGEKGTVNITSYINNLNTQKYPHFSHQIEELFCHFVPGLKNVVNTPIKDLQVIVKVGAIMLNKDKPQYWGGSWHLEGMPYEHIAATGIHYLTVEGITESYLEFRKPTILNQENIDYPQCDSKYTTHHYGIEPGSHFEGQMNRYLGLIKCQEGASVIFPNTLQHRVKDFKLDGSATGIRIIIAFFVIDPNHRIISTKDIPPQQDIITRKDAEHYRDRLMLFRKYYVDSLNKIVYEREFSLCEH